jgi:hypothetical protein
MREGWVCPYCHRGVSPDQKTCNHVDDLPKVTQLVDIPINDLIWQPDYVQQKTN